MFWAAIALLFLTPAQAATIIYSNDVMGELQPCGCRENPLGGMSRKANAIRAQKDPLLLLDAGDLLFSTDKIPELLKEQSELQATYLLKAMALLHHNAVVPGEKDFALGVKAFDRIRRTQPQIKFLAANLKKKDGKKFLEPYAVFNQVAVIGLVGKGLSWPKDLQATSPIESAKTLVNQLKKKAQVIVALTHQGFQEDLKLAKAVPEIDMIIGAHSQSFFQNPMQEGKTRIYQSSFRNQYVGVIALDAHGKQPDENKLIALDAGFDSAADKPNAIDSLISEFKAEVAKLNSRQELGLEKTAAANVSEKDKFHTFPKCAECHLKQFDFWRKTNHAMALQTLVKNEQTRNKECLSCHTVGLGDPKGFTNVTALAELVIPGDEQKAVNLTSEELSGYLREIHDAKELNRKVKMPQKDIGNLSVHKSLGVFRKVWAPVQCENCHFPGENHPLTSGYSKKVEKTVCLGCHTQDRAPGWYSSGQPDWKTIDAKRALITCPSGDLEVLDDDT